LKYGVVYQGRLLSEAVTEGVRLTKSKFHFKLEHWAHICEWLDFLDRPPRDIDAVTAVDYGKERSYGEEGFYRHLFITISPASQPIWNEWNTKPPQAKMKPS